MENVWLKLNKNDNTKESIVDAEEILKLVNGTYLDNINVQNIEELLQAITGESLSDDDRKELVKQVYEDDEIITSEGIEQKEL